MATFTMLPGLATTSAPDLFWKDLLAAPTLAKAPLGRPHIDEAGDGANVYIPAIGQKGGPNPLSE